MSADLTGQVHLFTIAADRALTYDGDGLVQPYMTLLSKDGKMLYVYNPNLNGRYVATTPGVSTVVFVDTGTKTVRRVVEVGCYPTGLALPGTHD